MALQLDYHEVEKYLAEIPKVELSNMLLNFAFKNDALHRTLIISTAIGKFKDSRDYKMLHEALIYTLSLPDHIPYNRAGIFRNVILPVLNFFNESVDDRRVMEILVSILPILEGSSWLLQDENSWYEAHKELQALLPD